MTFYHILTDKECDMLAWWINDKLRGDFVEEPPGVFVVVGTYKKFNLRLRCYRWSKQYLGDGLKGNPHPVYQFDAAGWAQFSAFFHQDRTRAINYPFEEVAA